MWTIGGNGDSVEAAIDEMRLSKATSLTIVNVYHIRHRGYRMTYGIDHIKDQSPLFRGQAHYLPFHSKFSQLASPT